MSGLRNVPLERYDSDVGCRFESLRPGENNTDELFVVLAFSGGGTRAAAFSYGALEGLAGVSTRISGQLANAGDR
jgi:hypothetical protein